MPVPAPEMGEHVAHRVVLEVAHVGLARGVGQHLEHIALGSLGIEARLAGIGHLPGALFLPDRLPLALDRVRVVSVAVGGHVAIVSHSRAGSGGSPSLRICVEARAQEGRFRVSIGTGRGTPSSRGPNRRPQGSNAGRSRGKPPPAVEKTAPARRPRRHSAVPVYRGRFGTAQAERLLWRAGFGPRPGEAKKLAKKGLTGAVHSLTRPGPERLRGPAPTDYKGRPLDPFNVYSHDQLWWLDQMVRSNRQLIERMTLVWHDWFATTNDEIGSARLMIGQNNTFRRRALGSFEKLLLDVTKRPRDARLSVGLGEHEGCPKRELRARDDGAVHDRGRSWIHRSRCA